MTKSALALAFLVVAGGCGKKDKDNDTPKPQVGSSAASGSGGSAGSAGSAGAVGDKPRPVRNEVERLEFNRLAVRLNLPVYWIADTNNDKNLDGDEFTSLLFYPAWTGDIDAAYGAVLALKAEPLPDASLPEGKRRLLVGKDLDAGRPTLVHTDARNFTAGEKAFLDHMLVVAAKIDALYAAQLGIADLAEKLPNDPESRSLFRRNWGISCVAPATEKEAECTALAGAKKPAVGVYPGTVDGVAQGTPAFCEKLEKRKDAEALLAPFTAVRDDGGKLVAVPYTQAWPDDMKAIAAELLAAAGALDASESALAEYLRAASKAFETNDWWPADEAWAKMNADNSKWYVRVGPDETYWEPCNHKSGFHLTLARINPASKAWQAKLAPVLKDMEAAIAAKAGAPYAAREVSFHLPDFIDIVVNAGDDRSALSATVGQSLPNFGPVKDANRGRTVAMVNLYLDKDSIDSARETSSSLLDAASMTTYSDDPDADLLGTILHEATHNLGPAGSYAVKGKTSDQVFGGPLAQVMEELKAQTGAWFLIDLIRQKGLITDAEAKEAYTSNAMWTLSQASKGMYEPDGARKTYSQLAAIQLGFFLEKGAFAWDAKATAANGKDTGAFVVHLDKVPAVAEELMKIVGGAMARGDKAAVTALVKKYVDGKVVPFAVLGERYGRVPKASFVYSIER
jgi:hypothetical protein